MKKKVLSVILCAALVFAMAVPAFAASRYAMPSYGMTYNIACWNGTIDSTGFAKILHANGLKVNMTVAATTSYGRYTWWYLKPPHGGGAYLRNVDSPQEVVNVYRVLQSGSYYPCTGYWFDGNGEDQRISVNGSQIYLTEPVMGGMWYLQADHTTISDSPVIFYSNGNRPQAQWRWIEAEND